MDGDQLCLSTQRSVIKIVPLIRAPYTCKPIASKFKRLSKHDQDFIQQEVYKLLSVGIVEISSSPWRAQAVVTKYPLTRHKKKLCIDYSQTINQCVPRLLWCHQHLNLVGLNRNTCRINKRTSSESRRKRTTTAIAHNHWVFFSQVIPYGYKTPRLVAQ